MTMAPDRRWNLTREAFERLLQRLGPDPEAAAREYEAIRRKLLDFFDFRRAPSPDVLADETLDRVARKLEEGEVVENVRAYVYGVAKRVLLEGEKRRAREQAAEDGLRVFATTDAHLTELRVRCLERCLEELPNDSRELIVGYYQGAGVAHLEGRKLLADRLGITYATLKTRAHRVRVRLEECLRRCLESENAGTIGPSASRMTRRRTS